MANNRGVSNVISIVLIIVVVMALVMIIWMTYNRLFLSSDFKVESGLLAVNLQVVQFDAYSNGAEIKLKRFPGGGKVDGLLFVFSDENGLAFKSVKNLQEITELEQRTFSFILPFSPKRVEIAPIGVSAKGKEFTGKITTKAEADLTNKNLPLPSSGAGLCIILRDSLSAGPCETISCGENLPVDDSLINRFCEPQEDGTYHFQCSVSVGCSNCANKVVVNSCAGIEEDSNQCQNSYEVFEGRNYGCMWDNWAGGKCFRSNTLCV